MPDDPQQTVLVVDDDEQAREIVSRKLARLYRVINAADGLEALERIERESVDLVILDVMMPRLDGFETCRRIKTANTETFLPVILLTALRDQDDRNRGLGAGADEFLSKPIDDHELRLRASALLKIRAQELTIREQGRLLQEAKERVEAQSEAALRLQNRLTHQIIDSLPVSLYVVDRQHTVVAWNRKREMGALGLPREHALGRSLYDLFRRLPREVVESEINTIFERGEPVSFECESTSSGELRHFRIQRLPMSVNDDEVTHVLTIGEDITDRRRLQASMMMTEKMAAVGRLAVGVAHEVNNPLATIVTCAAALQDRLAEIADDSADTTEFTEYLEIVQEEAFRARRISDNLLDFGRSERSAREPTDLAEACERTLRVLRHHAGFKGVEVECDFEPELPRVLAEADALVQVLVALVVNALDAMSGDGRLILSTSLAGDEVCCAVRDTGCGIGREDLSSVFEPFFTTKPVGQGTGLGLAVCYGIVQNHGGRIDVDSTIGDGTTFTVVLPAAAHVPQEVHG